MSLSKIINYIAIFLVVMVILSFFFPVLNNYKFLFLFLAAVVGIYSIYDLANKKD